MEMLQISQLTKVFFLVFFLTLLFLAPFISNSMRSSYLYIILNLLIIVLGIEAGFLSAILKPRDDKNILVSAEAVTNSGTSTHDHISMQPVKPMIMEKPEKKVNAEVSTNSRMQALNRCKSRPSLFFIASCEPECKDKDKDKEEEEEVVGVKKVMEEVGELSKKELYMKAEMFIGDFYKQLRMQRENSWQKVHGLCHKAF